MGLFATGINAFGKVAGAEVKVSSDAPGPQRIMAWKPGDGRVACGMIDLRASIASKGNMWRRTDYGVRWSWMYAAQEDA